jgi:hypothetical protein
MRASRFGPFDPRNPWHVQLVTLLTMLVLGWFVWLLAGWPQSVIFTSQQLPTTHPARRHQHTGERRGGRTTRCS